jgi:flagellar hook-associated protein 1 FlgK
VVDSAADPDQRVIAYQGAGGATRELADSQISGGSLGGLLAFRDNSLEPAQLKLDQLAHGFAAQVNKVHENGKDLNGGPGGVFFTINDPKKAQPGQPKTYENASNTGSAKLSASFITGDADKVKASNYQVIFDGSQYQVTRLTDNTTVASGNAGDMLSFDGLNVSTPGTPPATGDSFLIKPLSNAAGSFDVAIKNPAKIAAGQGGGVGDNTNAKALADLENAKTIEGNRSFNDDYAQLVADIGNKTQTLQTNSDAEKTLTDELTQSQQSVSGVNLNEESVNLVYYQQMYQANAQVIRTASTLFDTLLNAI